MWFALTLVLLFSLGVANSQPDEYNPKGTRAYLVNYGAIRNDMFLTKLALRRFAFLDEAYQKEIDFIRRFDKDYLILFYKDIVALNDYLPEFKTMILEEDAFLHTSEPSSLTVGFDNVWKFYWMGDRRFDSTVKVAYRVYWGFDSSGTFAKVDTIVNGTELEVSLPKSARWVLLKSVINDSVEIPYGFPVRLFYDSKAPMYVPILLKKNVISGWETSTLYQFKFKLVGGTKPDSVYIYADFDKDNKFNEKPLVFTQYLDTIYVAGLYSNEIKAGIELYMICFKDGTQHRLPKVGYWTTNPNNRIKNEEYNFYVMDVGNKKWRKNYIEQVEKAFLRGYNGLFADDTWYRVSNWGVDAYPPINYDDSVWKSNIKEFLSEIKFAIGKKPLFFNGLYASDALPFLEIADGGMDEGFGYTHWSGYVTGDNWRNSCNRGIICQNTYGKAWLSLGGIQDNSPEPRLYCISSYLLVSDDKSYFGNATNYQVFAHYPEFDIPTGKPLEYAQNTIAELEHKDSKGKVYYKREFKNCVVFVNPSAKDTVSLPEIQGKPQVFVDDLLTIEGGRLFTIYSDSVLYPKSAKIILKGDGSKLTSPKIQNLKAKIFGLGKDEIRVRVEAECADSSSANFLGDQMRPLYVFADLSKLGIWQDFVLKNDGTPAREEFSKYFVEKSIPPGANLKNAQVPVVALSTTGLLTIAYAELKVENIDTSNAVPNFSFEYDSDLDAMPDNWYYYRKGYIYDTTGSNAQHLKCSIKIENQNPTDTGGAFTKIVLNQKEFKPILISGWSKAENVSGKPDNNYSIYVDFFSIENQPWYGKTTKFSTGTHDWEYSATIHNPPILVSIGIVYCLFRAHSGTVWFDNVFVGEVDTTATYVDQSVGISIRVPSIVTGEGNDVIILANAKSESANIEIYNIVGERTFSGKFALNSLPSVIPLHLLTKALLNGTYFVRIEIEGKTYSFPFLVMR